jgi:hypothetical protein
MILRVDVPEERSGVSASVEGGEVRGRGADLQRARLGMIQDDVAAARVAPARGVSGPAPREGKVRKGRTGRFANHGMGQRGKGP